MQHSFSTNVQRLTGGNAVGEQLYHSHARALFAYIRLHLSGLEECEDLLLEVFLAALEQLVLLATMNETTQRAWLYKVAHHKIIDHYRRSRRRSVIALDALAETLYEDEMRSPEQIALSREELTRVRTIVTGLPTLQQQIVQLRFLYGLRTAEIAEALGKKEGTVRQLLWRALKLVRALYMQGD